MRNFIILTFILIAAALLRAGYLLAPHMDSDQAVFGLAGWHILQGEFPVFQWGYHYMGTLQSYIDALVFALFGLSREALNAVPLFLSLIFIVITYFLGKELMYPKAGLLAALICAIGPEYLVLHGAWARHGYLETMIFGSLLMLLTLKITTFSIEETNNQQKKYFLWFGFIAGMAWWTNFLIFYYFFACGLYLLIYDKKFLLRKNFYFLVLAFFIGSLPFWLYNFFHSFASFTVFQSKTHIDVWKNFCKLFYFHLPIILGARPNQPLIWKVLILSLYGFITLWFVTRKQAKSFLLPVFFVIGVIVTSSVSRFGTENTQRYLLPLYSVLPLFIVNVFFSIKEKSRWAAYGLIAILFCAALQDNALSLPWLHKEKIERYREDQACKKKMLHALLEKKIYGTYCDSYWIGPTLTFDCQEKVIFAHPFSDRNPLYTRKVDSLWNPAYLTVGGNIGLESSFQSLNVSFEKFIASPYTFYTSFKHLGLAHEEISPQNWDITSSDRPRKASLAIDGNLRSVWMSEKPQTTGMTLTIKLPKIENLAKIGFFFGNARYGVPGEMEILLSKDGKKWNTVKTIHENWGFFWSGTHPFNHGIYGRTEIAFDPIPTRFVRFKLTRPHTKHPDYWAFAEIVLSRATKEPFPHPDPAKIYLLSKRLAQWPKHQICADTWLAAHLQENFAHLKIASSWKAPEGRHSFKEHTLDFSKPVILIATAENQHRIQEVLEKALVPFHREEISPYTLFVISKHQTPGTWFWTGKQLFKWKRI